MLHVAILKYCTTIIGQFVLKIEGVFNAQPDRKLRQGYRAKGMLTVGVT